MKKIAYILGIICAMTMQSCLDLEPKTQLADTNYWKSPEHFKLFATQFYSWSADFRWLDDSQHADIRSDLFAGSTVNIYSNGTNSIPSSDKHYTDNYNRIRQTNTLLQQADTYEQQADIAISVGEARFFRAYCYFNLVRAFGEVPLVTFKVNDASEANVPKTTAEEIYKQIDSDLTQAEGLLPRQWQSAYLGRLTWGSARALHARTYMMRNDWQNMYTAATDVMNSGQYNLNTPYDVIFTDEGENSSESVFELQCASTAALPASDKIGSQFCEVQGVRGSGQWDLGWGWHMGTELMGEAFEPGDPRKDATLLYFRRSDTDPITPENTNKPYGESPVSQADGTYFNKKAYTNPALREEFTWHGFWVNIRIIRYGDVVLMAAESANELGKTGEASNYLEMVRARARGNNPDILPKVTSLDQTVLRDAIRHERRVELGLESGRFYDRFRRTK